MLFTQHRLAQPKCLSKYLFCLLVLALIPQHRRQVVNARQREWMLFRLLVLALVSQHYRQVVHAY
jgi:hypothetical protein